MNRESAHGIICGHIHHAEIETKENGILYMNSGDWVESSSALVRDEEGNWKILRWDEERQRLGLGALHKKADENPNADMRPITHQQIEKARGVWPGRNHEKLLTKLEKAERKVEKARRALEETEGAIENAVLHGLQAAEQRLQARTMELALY